MFERYTEKARRVIFFARYEASQFGAPAIEPEHLLLGLMREDKTLTARFLARAQASLEAIRMEIVTRTPPREKISTSVELPLSPEAKRVLAYAHEESDRLQHRHIGTEHLLLGLLREERSMAAEILYERGLRLKAVRDEVDRPSLLGGYSAVSSDAQVTEVNWANKRLEDVPTILRDVRGLKILDLSNNELRSLPEFIRQLSELEILDLSNNLLTKLPDSLASLRSLQSLYLHGNDQLNIPAEILGPSRLDVIQGNASPAPPDRILNYYYRIRTGGRSLNEAKLILVGRGGAGKTSIVNSLVHDFFQHEKKTEGIQITKWNLRLRGSELVRLNVWDFGGQEIMHATHQFFLTERSLYLLVLSGREGSEDADADYWLKLIESFGGDSPVIVVLNKSNEYPFDVNRRALRQKYPAIRDFVRTDCMDRIGITDLHKIIERETDRLPNLRDSFPGTWFAIKDKLAGMSDNHISFDRYRELCSEHGEVDQASQELLSSYLHSLGIVLNYKDDPRLQDTHVLKPQWVTGGIYTVLNSEMVENNKGEIHLKDLSKILDQKDYPAKMHRFLFDLMKKFELCFSFPDDDCRYLIPELLDKQEPLEAAEFVPSDCLNFQYHYTVLPEGLIPRFIVRTHSLSEGLPRWRTGVILQFEGNSGLVKADVQDRKIYASISGPPSGRRRLLAIIRSDFERIHHDIRKLDPQEMVPLPDHPRTVVPFEELLVLEQNGVATFPKVVGKQIIELNVANLLNGVDIEKIRRLKASEGAELRALKLFYSYSHKDEGSRNELETHLKLLQRRGLIKPWHDRNIEAGTDWKEKIDDNLERADIILLLISANFMASDYCYEMEMTRALERHGTGTARVIPIIVKDVSWSSAPFSKLQALPVDGEAVTKWADRDSAWRAVSEGIERVINEMHRKGIDD